MAPMNGLSFHLFKSHYSEKVQIVIRSVLSRLQSEWIGCKSAKGCSIDLYIVFVMKSFSVGGKTLWFEEAGKLWQLPKIVDKSMIMLKTLDALPATTANQPRYRQ